LSVRAFVQIIGLQFGEDSGWTVLSDLDGRLVRFENGRVVVYVLDDNEQTLGNEIALAEAAVGESENNVVFIFELMAKISMKIHWNYWDFCSANLSVQLSF
jgi:hypothetical protein